MSNTLTTSRLWDLVRHQRHTLFDEELISQEEFAALVEPGAESARRLESYDEMRAKIDRLERQRNEAIRALTHLYESIGRQGWEDGPTEREAIEAAHSVLCNFYGDPYPRKDREIPGEDR